MKSNLILLPLSLVIMTMFSGIPSAQNQSKTLGNNTLNARNAKKALPPVKKKYEKTIVEPAKKKADSSEVKYYMTLAKSEIFIQKLINEKVEVEDENIKLKAKIRKLSQQENEAAMLKAKLKKLEREVSYYKNNAKAIDTLWDIAKKNSSPDTLYIHDTLYRKVGLLKFLFKNKK